MKMKQRLRGFTLVELVIVMALFSLIVFSVLQLLIPVTKFFIRSGNFESATACMDNMKIAIEGNLKYADRVRCYVDYQPYAANPSDIHDSDSSASPGHNPNSEPVVYAPSEDMFRHVQNFYNEFFGRNKSQTDQAGPGGRQSANTILATNNHSAEYANDALRDFVNCRGTIYVMVFDNSLPANYNETGGGPIDSLQRFNELRKNAGKIVMYEFPFDNTVREFVATSAEYTVQPWYVNQKLYGNFDYQFILNEDGIVAQDQDSFHRYLDPNDPDLGEEGAETRNPAEQIQFRPEDCTIWIRSFEVSKIGGDNQPDGTETVRINGSGSGPGLMRNNIFKKYSSSFSMKNVLEVEGSHENLNYEDASMDYKIFHDEAMAGYDPDRTAGQEYFQDMLYPVPRYLPPFNLTDANNHVYRTLYQNNPERQEPCEGPNYDVTLIDHTSTADTGFRGNIDNTSIPGFYFIFTVPETTSGFRVEPDGRVIDANDYMRAVENAFPT